MRIAALGVTAFAALIIAPLLLGGNSVFSLIIGFGALFAIPVLIGRQRRRAKREDC